MICSKCKAELPDRSHVCYSCRSVFMYKGETSEQATELARQEYAHYLRQQQEATQEQHEQPEQQEQPDQSARQEQLLQDLQEAWNEIETQREKLKVQQQELQAQQQKLERQRAQLELQQQQFAQQASLQAQNQTPQAQVPSMRAEQPATYMQTAKATSGAAVASLVLGIVAIATSFLPIVNNASFFVAIVGLVFAIVGIAGTGRSKEKKGRGLAVAGLLLAVASIALVFATQSYYGSLIGKFTDRMQQGEKPAASSKANADYSNMAVGESVTLESGLTVSVVNVQVVEDKYANKARMCVTVSYANNGNEAASYNLLDWKSENADGVERSIEMPIGDDNSLDSGRLKPGGTITGNVYFENDITKVYYYSNGLFQRESTICWNL